MSTCNPLVCIPKPCFDSNVGGISKLFLIDIEDVDLSTVTITNGNITAVTLLEDFVEFSFPKNSGNAIETKQTEIATGAGIFEQTITISLPYRNVTTRNAIQLAASGNRDLWAVILDGNGLYWVYGLTAGVNLTTTEGQTGENRQAGSRYNLTFTGQEGALVPTITGSLVVNGCGEA